MDPSRLNKIIDQKNEQLEQDAVGQAQRLIDTITSLQLQRVSLDLKISEARKQLKEIEVTQVDAKAILGE
jgi:chaperonin cofactor prefoldin